MTKKGIIYKVTHKESGLSYVGATTNGIERRKRDHLELAKRGVSSSFQNAIATYGSDAFKWEQIDTAASIDELARKEKEYILKYNSKECGYNSDVGGGIRKSVYQYNIDGGLVNKFKSLESAGNAVSADKRNISKAALGRMVLVGGYVWSYSSTFPRKLKDKRKKTVIQIGKDGSILAEYKSVVEASKITGVNKTSIAKVCRGERKRSGGFYWVYET